MSQPTIDYQQSPYVQAYPENAEFWAAAASGRFLIKRCQACGKAHWYPRVVCPLCGSGETVWSEASGQGRLYSYSVVERADPPYVLAYVELEEGPILISNLFNCEPGDIRIGMALRVRWVLQEDGRHMPFFEASP